MIYKYSWHINKIFSNERASSFHIPILAYHRIAGDNSSATRDVYTLIESQFEAQMCYLYEHGYACLSLMDVFRSPATGKLKPGKSFILTFDDGCEDFYIHAYPILRKYGFVATNFLISDWVGKRSSANEPAATPRLSWEQIRALSAEGFSFGSHTCLHANLTDINNEQIWHELMDSKESLEAGLRQEILYLAYPYGASTPAIRKLTRQAGYQAAFGVNTGEPGLFNIWRAEINAKDTILSFRFKMTHWFSYQMKLRGWVRESTAIGRYLRGIKVSLLTDSNIPRKS
jgi:peptidoglycan/xylan/chitin deacetylase (PgdA/CDA1 family)